MAQKHSPKPVVIFDFDGTLADTFPVVLDIFHRVERRAVPLNKEEELLMRSAALMQVKLRVVIRAAAKLNISFWRLPFVFVVSRFLLKRRMTDVLPYAGMPEMINELAKRDYRLFIVSTNSASNIKKFLKARDMHDSFAKVYGGVRSKEKARVIRGIIKRQRITADSVMYVGDENRDMVAGRLAGVKTVAVTWGYNDIAQLTDEAPTYVCKSPAELIKVIGGRS